jgi:hypothetical protein
MSVPEVLSPWQLTEERTGHIAETPRSIELMVFAASVNMPFHFCRLIA